MSNDFCENKSICIVGPANLEKNMSELIDSHDIVVRMNNYKNVTSSYYGTKRTIYIGSYLFGSEIDNDFEIYLCIAESTFQRFSKMKKYLNCNDNVAFVDITTNLKNANIYNKKYCPTNGLIALYIFLSMIESITQLSIVGMSFGLTSYNEQYNNTKIDYFNDIVSNGKHSYKEDCETFAEMFHNLNDQNKGKIFIENTKLKQFVMVYK